MYAVKVGVSYLSDIIGVFGTKQEAQEWIDEQSDLIEERIEIIYLIDKDTY